MRLLVKTSVAVILLTGCNPSSYPLEVSNEQYADRRLCWKEDNAFIEGLMVIRKNSLGNYFPQLLSAYCYTASDMSLTHGLNLPIIGDRGDLMRLGVIDKPLSNNIVTDQMPGSVVVRVIAFRGALRPVPGPSGTTQAYELYPVSFAADTGLTIEEVFSIGPQGRWARFQAKLNETGSNTGL